MFICLSSENASERKLEHLQHERRGCVLALEAHRFSAAGSWLIILGTGENANRRKQSMVTPETLAVLTLNFLLYTLKIFYFFFDFFFGRKHPSTISTISTITRLNPYAISTFGHFWQLDHT